MTNKTLSDENRKDLVLLRIEKAMSTYSEAVANVSLNLVNASANRLYYSAYYAVSALLLANGITARTHSGVRDMLGLHFIKSGLLSERYGKLFTQLFSLRMTGDYEDLKNLDMEVDVKPLVEPAKELIEVVTKMAMEKIQEL